MKKLLTLIFIVMFSLTSVQFVSGFELQANQSKKAKKTKKSKKSKSISTSSSSSSNGYIRGRRGGCYYINRNGNKTYVARSLCR